LQTFVERFPRHGAIHGARVNVTIAETRRNSPGNRSFASAGRTINRNDQGRHSEAFSDQPSAISLQLSDSC
jgi:hypothetical protein